MASPTRDLLLACTLLAGVRRVEIESAGHVVYVDRPARVRGLVREFVRSVARPQDRD